MGRRIASESKQTVRGGPKPAKVGLHRRLASNALIGCVPTERDNLYILYCGNGQS